ncbi:MAG: decaprenyl-phosphate phosphoribosyltransferase [Planctomycetes bacterium]|nr:decaprenyl-phosphate phosphoribosyltransferase [Planctomycetota bacterium]MBI3834840.1 decaprenyl-phosphate phosphoribosyltransferase [Planctomycetota bacterium]
MTQTFEEQIEARRTDQSAPKASARLRDVVLLLRPSQWVKNIVVFAAPAAALKLSSAEAIRDSIWAFVAFSLAASAMYCINDVVDREADASHPEKKYRPIASGRVSILAAVCIAVVLATSAFAISLKLLPSGFAGVLFLYLSLMLAYSITLKRRVLLDVIIVAFGFVLRAVAGAVAVGVTTTEWLAACVFTLCMFMGFGKRRCEIAMIANADELRQHRRTLLRYTPDLLNHLITVSAGVAVITFLLYTLDSAPGHPSPFPRQQLFYTLPIVVYGIFRFAMLTETGRFTGPTEIVLRDKAMLATIALWAVCALMIVYQQVLVGPRGIVGLFDRL